MNNNNLDKEYIKREQLNVIYLEVLNMIDKIEHEYSLFGEPEADASLSWPQRWRNIKFFMKDIIVNRP